MKYGGGKYGEIKYGAYSDIPITAGIEQATEAQKASAAAVTDSMGPQQALTYTVDKITHRFTTVSVHQGTQQAMAGIKTGRSPPVTNAAGVEQAATTRATKGTKSLSQTIGIQQGASHFKSGMVLIAGTTGIGQAETGKKAAHNFISPESGIKEAISAKKTAYKSTSHQLGIRQSTTTEKEAHADLHQQAGIRQNAAADKKAIAAIASHTGIGQTAVAEKNALAEVIPEAGIQQNASERKAAFTTIAQRTGISQKTICRKSSGESCQISHGLRDTIASHKGNGESIIIHAGLNITTTQEAERKTAVEIPITISNPASGEKKTFVEFRESLDLNITITRTFIKSYLVEERIEITVAKKNIRKTAIKNSNHNLTIRSGTSINTKAIQSKNYNLTAVKKPNRIEVIKIVQNLSR